MAILFPLHTCKLPPHRRSPPPPPRREQPPLPVEPGGEPVRHALRVQLRPEEGPVPVDDLAEAGGDAAAGEGARQSVIWGFGEMEVSIICL